MVPVKLYISLLHMLTVLGNVCPDLGVYGADWFCCDLALHFDPSHWSRHLAYTALFMKVCVVMFVLIYVTS